VERVEDAALQAGFGLVLVAMGAHLAWGHAPRPRDASPAAARAGLVALGALGGVLAGAFGVGGGVVMVPGMVLAGVGMHLAVGTSLVAVAANAAVGTLVHATLGYGAALLALGLPLALGAVPGTRLGSLLAHRLDAARLRRAFGVFLVLLGLAAGLQALVRW
ncbi:MAG TPA: TSUP family transporter, partial [Candidatus Thermoplasmatota archaeon]|nr:TSUP family transporter [Candidatus Thermoplasmatota archaeon]